MNAAISLDEFITHRRSEAKKALRELDSGLVMSMDSYDSAVALGLILPAGLAKPSVGLSEGWHEMLELTVRVGS